MKKLIFVILIWLLPSVALCTDYFVDTDRADDSGNGTTTGTAFKHSPDSVLFSRSPNITLVSGDKVHFKRGTANPHIGKINATVATITYDSYLADGTTAYGTGVALFDAGTDNRVFLVRANNITIYGLKFTGGVEWVPSSWHTRDMGNCVTDPRPNCVCGPALVFEDVYCAMILVGPATIKLRESFMYYPTGQAIGSNFDSATTISNLTVSSCVFEDCDIGAIMAYYLVDSLITLNTSTATVASVGPPVVYNIANGSIGIDSGCERVTVSYNELSRVTTGWAAIYGTAQWDTRFHTDMKRIPDAMPYCKYGGETYYFNNKSDLSAMAKDLVIEHNYVHDCWSSGIFMGGIRHIVQYNEIYNMNNGRSPAYVAGSTTSYGFYMLGGSYTYDSKFRFNIVHGCKHWVEDGYNYGWPPKYEGHALYLELYSWDNEYYGNLIYDNETAGANAVVGGGNKFYNNSFWNNNTAHTDATFQILQQRGLYIANNIIVNSSSSYPTMIIFVGEPTSVPNTSDVMFICAYAPYNTNMTLRNNIFYDTSDTAGTETHIQTIHFYASGMAYTSILNDSSLNDFATFVSANPSWFPNTRDNLWVDPKYTSTSDFRLSSLSPAFGIAYYDDSFMGGLMLLDPFVGAVTRSNIASIKALLKLDCGAFTYQKGIFVNGNFTIR